MRKINKSTILVVLFLFFITFFISSCGDAIDTIEYYLDEDLEQTDEPPEEIKKQVDEAIKEANKEMEQEKIAAEELSEKELFPNEPITYSGDALGLDLVMMVNFKTKEVTGSISLSGDDYVDASITNGKINLDTLQITTNFSGIMGSREYGKEYPFNGTITGIISDDLSEFTGEIFDDEGEGGVFEAAKH